MDATFEEVVKLAEQLEPEQQDLLIYRLRVKQASQQGHEQATYTPTAEAMPDEPGSASHEAYHSPTRTELLHAAELLRHTPVRLEDRLLGKYANPNVPDMSAEAFHAQMHAIATEWEQELDEFTSDEA